MQSYRNIRHQILISLACAAAVVGCDDSTPEDKSCPDGQIYQEDSGKCENIQNDTPECSDDKPCPEGKSCNDGKCENKTENDIPECNDDKPCPEGKSCNNGTCEDNLEKPESCVEDKDCNTGEVCIENRCTKVETPDNACQIDENCSNGERCVGGTCVKPECAVNEDCKNEHICVDSFCIVDPLSCTTDIDCPKGLFCSNKRCIDPSIECYESSECAGSKQCIDHQCQYECIQSKDCIDDKICKSGRCQYECNTDDECGDLERCQAHRCTDACEKDNDCRGTSICKNKQCQPECTVQTQATDCKNHPNGPACADNQCHECSRNQDCGENEVCQLYRCEPSKDILFPCIINDNNYIIVDNDTQYSNAKNTDGSINICKLGYRPRLSDIESNTAEDKCIPFYQKRNIDIYGDGIDSNCDGYDYDISTAIFVNESYQGIGGGNDANSGKYHPEDEKIYPLATLNAALNADPITLIISGKAYSYHPDIIVSKNVASSLNGSIQIPTYASDSLDSVILTKTLLNDSNRYDTPYQYHVAMINELNHKSFKSQDYNFHNEFRVPKEMVRIYGGFSFNSNTPKLWMRSVDERSKLSRNITTASDRLYTLIEAASNKDSISLYMDQFDLTLRADYAGQSTGTTLAGIHCGKNGCRSLNLSNATFKISAPNGVNANAKTPVAGANGNNGKNGSYAVDNFNGYNASTYCNAAQSCSGTTILAGLGGCGGYAKSDTSLTSSTKYDGVTQGKDGTKGSDIAAESGTISGGAGGSALAVSCNHDTCSDNSVDTSKGTGKSGSNGANGKNGSKQYYQIRFVRDGELLYAESNYATEKRLQGVAGAPGGGGGGGSVYQIYSGRTGDSAWVSAGAGGNGGCGGNGGLAGGTGGSAIGLIAKADAKRGFEIHLSNAMFNVTAGNGGLAQNGAQGGNGGNGGPNVGFRDSNMAGCIECLKATAGGNGGNGGNGGAGAGGIAGLAYGFLFTCDKKVTDNCQIATLETPCFTDTKPDSIQNCGFKFDDHFMDFIGGYVMATPGNDADDALESGKAATTFTPSNTFATYKTWIEK